MYLALLSLNTESNVFNIYTYRFQWHSLGCGYHSIPQGFGISIDIDIPEDGKLVFDHRVSYIKVKLSVRSRVQTNLYIYI